MDKDTRREDEFRGGGWKCTCFAYHEGECGCGADWTTKKEWEQERTIAKLEERVKVLENEAKDVWCPFMSPAELRENVVKLESTIAEMARVLVNFKQQALIHNEHLVTGGLCDAIDSVLRIASKSSPLINK
jgi:hypothetical protein